MRVPVDLKNDRWFFMDAFLLVPKGNCSIPESFEEYLEATVSDDGRLRLGDATFEVVEGRLPKPGTVVYVDRSGDFLAVVDKNECEASWHVINHGRYVRHVINKRR